MTRLIQRGMGLLFVLVLGLCGCQTRQEMALARDNFLARPAGTQPVDPYETEEEQAEEHAALPTTVPASLPALLPAHLYWALAAHHTLTPANAHAITINKTFVHKYGNRATLTTTFHVFGVNKKEGENYNRIVI